MFCFVQFTAIRNHDDGTGQSHCLRSRYFLTLSSYFLHYEIILESFRLFSSCLSGSILKFEYLPCSAIVLAITSQHFLPELSLMTTHASSWVFIAVWPALFRLASDRRLSAVADRVYRPQPWPSTDLEGCAPTSAYTTLDRLYAFFSI